MPLIRFLICFVVFALISNAVSSAAEPNSWDVYSDTWVATDGLGRTLPGFEQTGPPKDGKVVAMFYFLWNGRHGEEGPYDVTKILAEDPEAMRKKDSPLWGKMYVPHHWAESIFGYYVGEDRWVLRKHAQMLGDAGVDVIVFDVTNQLTYPESYMPLCEVFSEVQNAGNHAPQIAFLCPFWSPKKVVHELWRDLYGKGKHSQTWYKFHGKPLILADPALILDSLESKRPEPGRAVRLENEKSALGQRFTIDRSFLHVGAPVPTWSQKDSCFTLALRKDGPEGEILKSQRFENHGDNQLALLEFEKDVPAGTYFLELSQPKGPVGWWTGIPPKELAEGFLAYRDAQPVEEHKFAIRIAYGSEDTAEILRFFTFRKPQPDYFVGPTGPNQWGWLEVYPQHPFYTLELEENAEGKVEEVRKIEQLAVGVAQNAVEGKLGVLSNPKAHGRSFHNGAEPPPEQCDYTGKNFEEQWSRAYELDPPVVFITGWNEWIMGRFDETAPFHGRDVVSFVDQFNQEFSRDIEPMIGGHEDAFYYQLIGHLRRFKGSRPLEKVISRPITVDGRFEDWSEVGPEFRDTIGDVAHRDERGWGKDMRYENHTGRNDIVLCKTARDEKNVYFYLKAAEAFKEQNDGKGLILFLDVDASTKTGWLGYDFVLNRVTDTANGKNTAVLEKNRDGNYDWHEPKPVKFVVGERELEVAIPIEILGNRPAIDWKWTDNLMQSGDASDFTLHGDSAPNDRYNYRAIYR